MAQAQYSYFKVFLPCLLILPATCMANSWDSRDITGLYQSQSELIHRRARSISNPIFTRLEKVWSSRRSRLTANNIQRILPIQNAPGKVSINTPSSKILAFENQFTSVLTKHLLSILEISQWHDNWVLWASGGVDIGKTGPSSQSSRMDHQTDYLTIGIEKNVDENYLLGIAIGSGEDKTGVGAAGSRMASNDLGLAVYGSIPMANNYHLEIIYGFNKFGMNTHRNQGTNIIKGKRHNYLTYQSINFAKEIKYSKLSFNPYTKINIGYANLRPYSESGASTTFKFSEQHFHLLKYHVGALVDYQLITSMGRFRPFARIEHGVDFSRSSGSHSSLTNGEGDGLHHIRLHHARASHWRFGVGLDFHFYDGLLSTSYDRWEESEMHLDNQPMRESDTLNLKILLKF